MTIYAGSGHRDEKIQDRELLRLAIHIELNVITPSAVICGMANGFDLLLGDTALDLGIPVVAAKPWPTHSARVADRETYARIIKFAEEVYVVTELEKEHPTRTDIIKAYYARNEWMVDNADEMLAYYNGDKKGGTFHCLSYAESQGKPIRNLYGKQTVQV